MGAKLWNAQRVVTALRDERIVLREQEAERSHVIALPLAVSIEQQLAPVEPHHPVLLFPAEGSVADGTHRRTEVITLAVDGKITQPGRFQQMGPATIGVLGAGKRDDRLIHNQRVDDGGASTKRVRVQVDIARRKCGYEVVGTRRAQDFHFRVSFWGRYKSVT